jgi:hypothetical protein
MDWLIGDPSGPPRHGHQTKEFTITLILVPVLKNGRRIHYQEEA